MTVKFNENDKYSDFALEVVKMFSNLAAEGGEPMVLTYTNGGIKMVVNDCHYDNHSLEIDNCTFQWVLENWGDFLPNWIENDTGYKDWTPWEYGEYTD